MQGVFEVDREEGGLILTEIADGITLEDIITTTGCEFSVPKEVKKMQQVDVDEWKKKRDFYFHSLLIEVH